jgi:hypothetical protein
MSLFARIAYNSGQFLSSFHLSMLDFSTSKTNTIFTVIGFLLIMILLRIPNLKLIILLKIYLGAFLPILFSFNQHNLINIDIKTGMLSNNFLRSKSYLFILLHRWSINLMSHFLSITLLLFLSFIFKTGVTISLAIYIVFINIFSSLFNLSLSAFFNNSSSANFILIIFVYLQLRDDVQHILVTIPLINNLNIFNPIVQEGHQIIFHNWITLLSLILISFFILILGLNRIQRKYPSGEVHFL